MIDIINISEKRYTTKHYNAEKQVTEDNLKKLLHVLRNAPSSVNSQPWHFFIINNKTAKEKILSAVSEFNHDRIINSSYTIVFCIKEELTDSYLEHLLHKEELDGRFPNEEIKQMQKRGRQHFVNLNNASEQQRHSWESRQLYIALGQFLFAAAALDIDSTAIEGFDLAKMDECLNLSSKKLKSVVLATIGYRDPNDGNAMRPKSRLDESEIFTFINN